MSARSKHQDHEEDVAEERRLASNPMRQKMPPPQDFSSRHAKEPASTNEDVQMQSTEPVADKTVPEVSRNEPVRASTPTVRQPGQAQANALRPPVLVVVLQSSGQLISQCIAKLLDEP